MKKIFLAATIALITLLISLTGAVYAVNAPQPDMEQILLKYGNKAEQDSKEELKKLVQDEVLKKNLDAARKEQQNDQASSTDNQKKEADTATN